VRRRWRPSRAVALRDDRLGKLQGAEGWAGTPRLLSMIAFDDALDSTTGASAGHRRCHPRPAGSRTAIEHQVRHCRQSLSDSSDDDTQSDGSTTSTSPPPPPTRDERPRPLSSACLRRTTTRLRHTCTTSTSTRAFTGADTVQRVQWHGLSPALRRMLLEHQQLDARSLGSQVALSVVRVQSPASLIHKRPAIGRPLRAARSSELRAGSERATKLALFGLEALRVR